MQPRDLTRFKKDIVDLLERELPDGFEEAVYREMLFNVAFLREEKLDMGDLRLLNTAFKELRYALKVFKPYRQVPKAAVFGSARTPVNHANFKLAAEFGKKLAKKGWMIITGGASGIMEAAMIGAGAEKSFGLNILLPFEQHANAVIMGNKKLIFFKYFFTRKLIFLKESDATVLFPGGFGTFDEGFESFTLVQTGKAKPRPLVLVDPPSSRFWNRLTAFLKGSMEKEALISSHDLYLLRHVHDAASAANEVAGFYRNYHSSRFFKDQYLIRLRRKVSPKLLRELGVDFRDILARGSFEELADFREDDVRDPGLCRIVFCFNRTHYSRLRELIDRLNHL